MLQLSTVDWIIVALCAALVGLSKTGLPGVGILTVLLLAHVLPARASVGVLLPMLITGDVFAVTYYRRHAVWSHLLRLMPWAAAGVVVGWMALGRVNDRQLQPIIGGIVLAMLAVGYWRNKKLKDGESIPTQWYFAAVLGVLAGVTTMMANAAGPIMAIYLLAMRLPKYAFIGTGAWYFLIMNCFKVPFSASLGLLTGQSLKLDAIMAPLVMAGALAGIVVAKHIPQKVFNTVIEVLVIAAAIKLLV